jgi:hypothetical protein
MGYGVDPLLDLFDPPHNQSAGDVFGRAAPGEGDVIGFGDLRVGDSVLSPTRT